MSKKNEVSRETLKERLELYLCENCPNPDSFWCDVHGHCNAFKKIESLVDELQKLEQNPNIHCNNCKDISAQNLLSWVLVLLGAKKEAQTE